MSLLIGFWTPFHDSFVCHLSQCVCPKTWQVLCFFTHLTQDLHRHSSTFFGFHSVSVQRRDRCSVTCPTHPFFERPPFSLPLLLVWLLSLSPVLSFGLFLSSVRVYLSKDVAGTLPLSILPSPPLIWLSCHTLRTPLFLTPH